MSVGLCGSHRTGKTTLAEIISQRTGVPFVRTATTEVFRECGLDPSQPMDFDKRLWIQHRILDAAEKIWSAERSGFITDRTPLDMAAYTLADIHGNTKANFKDLEEYLERCFKATNGFFRTIVLIQPGIPLVHEEGKAALNEGYLEHLNYLMMGLCNDGRISSRFFCLPREVKAIEDRVNSILRAIDEAKGEGERVP
jgi:hypothetical protein